jgi:major membrane immunogen (membrane-anchored lipoprotein)
MTNNPAMKRSFSIFAVCIIPALFSVSSFDSRRDPGPYGMAVQDTLTRYRDGLYEGQSQSDYLYEPYWGKVQVKIRNGRINRVNFMIRDSNLHETFNDKYGKHFEGNEEYIKQCINDWNGVRTYPKLLRKTRDINRVDAISGATWSYNIFRASLNEALKKAFK